MRWRTFVLVGLQPGNPVSADGIIVDYAIADVDGDGREDVVVADASGDLVPILLSDGAGGWEYRRGPSPGAGSVAIAAGDLNDDGAVDIVTADEHGVLRAFIAAP